MKLKQALASAAIATPLAVSAAPVVLNFEGIAPHNTDSFDVSVDNYYNGGAASNGAVGPNLGIAFSEGARVACLNTTDLNCSAVSKAGLGLPGSGLAGMAFNPGDSGIINVFNGFSGGFALAYANPFGDVSSNFDVGIKIFDGLNGTGNILAQILDLPTTPHGGALDICADYGAVPYCPFGEAGLAFSGVAKSVQLTGLHFAFVSDDLTFGSRLVGRDDTPVSNGTVPEPGTLALTTLAGIAALGVGMRRRKTTDAKSAPVLG